MEKIFLVIEFLSIFDMSCYHPLVGIFNGKYNESGKKHYDIEGHLNPFEVAIMHPGSVLIPCGHCLGCKLDYSRSWADRMMLELEDTKKGIFITLTYDNEHITWSHFDSSGIPDAGTLVKRDLQLWMKRLRKCFTGKEIRFYAAGEYGSSTFRPHYHVILFGIGLDDIHDLHRFGVNEFGQAYYISDSFARIWNNGFVLLSTVSWKTCAYVARYVTKKLGDNILLRDALNQEPEFSLMSRKPGLARRYLDKHYDCLDFQSINLSTPEGGLKISIPKYFLKCLEKENVDRYNQIMEDRRSYAEDRMLLTFQSQDLEFVEFLENLEVSKIKQTKSLMRDSI